MDMNEADIYVIVDLSQFNKLYVYTATLNGVKKFPTLVPHFVINLPLLFLYPMSRSVVYEIIFTVPATM
jgi:hypothetical protein